MSFEQTPGFSEKFKEFLWPFSLTYAFKWKMEFLCCLQPDSLFQHEGPLLVRDGELPLSHFFHEHPQPRQNTSLQLILSHRMAALVPEAWKPCTRFYRLRTFLEEKEPPRELLLLAHLPLGNFSLTGLNGQLDQIKTKWGEAAFRGMKKSVFFKLPRWDDGPLISETSVVQCLMEMGNLLGSAVSILDWKEMVDRSSFEGCLVMEPWPSRLFADNHLTHLTLSRRGRLFPSPGMESNGVEKISPYHGFKMEDQAGFSNERLPFVDWPEWLGQWYSERRGIR